MTAARANHPQLNGGIPLAESRASGMGLGSEQVIETPVVRREAFFFLRRQDGNAREAVPPANEGCPCTVRANSTA